MEVIAAGVTALHRHLLTFLVSTTLAAAILWWAIPRSTVPVRVRWSPGVSSAARLSLERQFSLEAGTPTEGTTRAYALADFSSANIRELVEHPDVADTQGVDRDLFRAVNPPPSRAARIVLDAVAMGAVAALLLAAGAWLVPRVSVRGAAPAAVIVAVVTLTYLPVLRSGAKVMINNDFFQYASRYESVAQAVHRYHTLPLRSHWLGGGFPTIADPEDPTLNPLILFMVILGTVTGIKVIGYLSMLVGGLATYALARRILAYTEWGALFSALVFGTCLFVPSRIAGGNVNEAYGAWLPLCLLLVALALESRRWAVATLAIVFYVMVSDGKLTALMAMFYLGVLCLLAVLPSLRVFAPSASDPRIVATDVRAVRRDYRPVAYFAVAVGLTIAIGLPRLLPAFEVIQGRGGIATMVAAHPQNYSREGVNAYSFNELWKGIVGWDRDIDPVTLNRDLVTVGMVPVVLSAIALLVFWRQTLAWAILLFLFCWLILAHHAPVDLLQALWNLPIFDTIYRPYKYFSFPIAFTLAIAAGRAFDLLKQLHSRRVEALIAVILIVSAVGFLAPRSASILANAFTHDPPPLEAAGEFFNVAAMDMGGIRPLGAAPYFNVLRNVGTLGGYTPVPVPTNVAPKYFVTPDNRNVVNPDYRGEAYFLESATKGTLGTVSFEPNEMTVSVDVAGPSTVIINQNYHRDWRSDRGTLSDHNGVIALNLTDPGSYPVHLRYRPRSFYAGIALAVPALAALFVIRRRLIVPQRSGVPAALPRVGRLGS